MRGTGIKIKCFFISVSVISLRVFIGLDFVHVTILNPYYEIWQKLTSFCRVRGAHDYQVPGPEQLIFHTTRDITFLVSGVLEVFVLRRTSEIHYDYVFSFCCFLEYTRFSGG
jgi:hypothetical protein